MSNTHVIKVGGAEGNDPAAVVRDVTRLWKGGQRFVLVHGGSSEATQLGHALGHPPQFAQSPSGHTSRLTDARTLEVFLMATALINRRLVADLTRQGVSAVGLCGADGAVLTAERKAAFRVVENGRVRVVRGDLSGKPVAANAEFMKLLLEAGHLPVLAPVGFSPDGQLLNVDGDRAAAQVAGALGADSLALLTSVPGLLRSVDDPESRIARVAMEALPAALDLAGGSMKKKVLAAQEALALRVRRVVIARSAGERPIQAALAGEGTVFENEAVPAC